MKLLLNLFTLLTLSWITAVAIVSHLPPDLSHIEGQDDKPASDLVDLLTQAAIKRSAPVEISEADLNRFVAATLTGHQEGKLAALASFDRVLVDLEPGVARVILCWRLHGYLTTTAMDFEITRNEKGNEFIVQVKRGAYGKLPVHRGYLLPMIPAYDSLAAACGTEIKALFQMTRIEIAKDKLVLDPRFL